MPRLRSALFPALLASAALVAACGSSGGSKTSSGTSTPSTSSSGKAVSVKEADFSLTPKDLTVSKAGTITITASNAGQTTHALEVEGNGVEKKTGDIAPGASAKLTVDLKPGKYEWYCPIDGHKQLGMKGTITVGGGSSSGTTTTSSSGGGTDTSGSSSNYGY